MITSEEEKRKRTRRTRIENHHHSSQSLFGITYYWTELSSTSSWTPQPLPPLSLLRSFTFTEVAIIFTLDLLRPSNKRDDNEPRGGGEEKTKEEDART